MTLVCPSCDAVVEGLLVREACPECGTDREVLFNLAAGYERRERREGFLRGGRP